MVPLGLTDHALGKEPLLLVASLLGLGMAAGPVQPINAELAVDVTYPSDETAVESVQQIGGNLISALLVPVAELMAKQDYQLFETNNIIASDVRGDVILLCCMALATMGYFSTFDAPLRRTIADCADDGVCEAPELNMISVDKVPGDDVTISGAENDPYTSSASISPDILASLKEASKEASNVEVTKNSRSTNGEENNLNVRASSSSSTDKV